MKESDQSEAKRPRFWVSAAIAIFAVGLEVLGFAGIDIWPLTFPAFVLFFFVLDRERQVSGWRVWWLGMIYGLAGNLGGYYWLIETMERFSGFSFVPSFLMATLVCGYQGISFAIFGWLWTRLRNLGWRPAFAAAASIPVAEWIFPRLFPFYVSNHLHELPHFQQIADLGGPTLVSAFIVFVCGVMYELLLWWRGLEILDRKTLITAGAVVVLVPAYGALRIAQIEEQIERSEKLNVGLVQVNMDFAEKRTNPMEGLRRHLQQSGQLERQQDPDLIVWPESAYSYFVPDEGNVQQQLRGDLKTPLLFGGLARIEVDGKRKLYNSAFMTDADGNVRGRYDKTFLLAFAEYIPFGEQFPVLYEASPKSGRFTPGTSLDAVPFGEHRIAALVCYEDIIPGFVREMVAHSDPHLLVNMTNDAWFGDTTEPWQHLALAKSRAVEHHKYLVRVTNSGVSAVVDPLGRTLKHTEVFVRDEFVHEVALMEGTTLYRTLGDWPAYLGVPLLLWAIYAGRRKTHA